jgi:PAS domain S-box-containing protein
MKHTDINDFSKLIEAIDTNFFFYIRDPDGKFTYVSPSQSRILGYSQKDFLKGLHGYLTDNPVNKAMEDTALIKSGKKQPPYELELFHKNGSIKRLRVFEHPFRDEDGSVIAVQGIASDITEQKHLEESLRQNEVFFKRTQLMAQIGSWFLDISKNRLQWSDQIYQIFEINPESFEASYEAFLNTIHPDDRELVNDAYIRSLEEKTPYSIEHRLLMPDGRVKYVHEECETFFDERGEPVSSFGTVQDITAMMELQLEHEISQELMFHQSKMAQMGEMINSIAHQWKQPLHQINSVLPSIEEDYENGTLTKETLAGKLDEIEILTNYMSETIESFKNFFNPNKQKKVFTISDAVEKVLILFRGELERSRISTEVKRYNECYVQGSEQEFVQALLTIMNNARECFIRRNVEEPKILITIGNKMDESIITINDNAGGIPQSHVDEIFDPYFTTKRHGNGTGLGLYIAKKVIETSLNGIIYAENGKEGAVFTIRFPDQKANA